MSREALIEAAKLIAALAEEVADLQHADLARGDAEERAAEYEAELSRFRESVAAETKTLRVDVPLDALLDAGGPFHDLRAIRARADAAEARLAEAWQCAADEREQRKAAEAEIEFMRAWCADHYGVMPPTREQNAAFMRALDEMEGDRG